MCADVNECDQQGDDYCEHSCVNTFGSFQCICRPGATLNADGRTCSGQCTLHGQSNRVYLPVLPRHMPVLKTDKWSLFKPHSHQLYSSITVPFSPLLFISFGPLRHKASITSMIIIDQQTGIKQRMVKLRLVPSVYRIKE